MSVSKNDVLGYGVKLFGLLFAGVHVAARLGLVAVRVLARYGWGPVYSAPSPSPTKNDDTTPTGGSSWRGIAGTSSVRSRAVCSS
ncbi:hypothetical protein [Halospeciosus flavus]|uniref:hypothetical protein n=1 Tax=Halospeciosus flavus TaxID=3032283 RepID=UPI003610CA4C